jgi:acetyl esterase/lipase
MPSLARRSLVVMLAAALPFAACASGRGEHAAAWPSPIVEPTGRFAAFPDLRYVESEGVAPPEQEFQSLDLVAPRELVDAVVAPTGAEPARELGSRPIVVFFHGGMFQGGDKRNLLGAKTPAVLGAGFLLASVNYRPSTVARHPAQIEDAAAALAWLHRRAPEFGGAPDRFVLVGHSSGAWLAAMLATDGRWLAKHGLSRSIVRGVVGLDGALWDLDARARGDASAEARLASIFGPDRATWSDASPARHVLAADDPRAAENAGIPPFLLFHAGDRAIGAQETNAFAAKLAAAGVRADVVHVPDRNHQTIHFLFGAPDDAVMARFLEFAQEVAR